MGLRFRRSIKLIPGVRLNFGKESMGLTFGPRGAHYTINTKGRHTVSGGLPGTGLWWQESANINSKSRTRTPQNIPTEPGRPENDLQPPGFFASGGDKAFYTFAENYLASSQQKTYAEIKSAAEQIKTEHPDIADYIDFVMIAHITSNEGANTALPICDHIWSLGNSFLQHTIADRYFAYFRATVPIARGITVTTDYNNNYFAYAYSEILQATGNTTKALEVIQTVRESDFKDVAILEIYLSEHRYQDILQATDDLENTDDLSALCLTFRAIALRELTEFDLAIETFKLALSKRSRSEEIRNYALYERACTYELMGKKAMAIKDLNKILLTDYENKEAREKKEKLEK